MELEFSKEDLIEIIVKYYKEESDLDVTVDIELDTAYTPGVFYDGGTKVPVIKVSGQIEAVGKKRAFTKTLTKDEFSEIIKKLLEKEGFKYRYCDNKFKKIEKDGSEDYEFVGMSIHAEKKITKTSKR